MSFHDIAEQLGLREAEVRSIYRRAVRKLKRNTPWTMRLLRQQLHDLDLERSMKDGARCAF